MPHSSRRDRLRTTNNILGDVYAAAVVERYSKDDLEELDKAAALAGRIATNQATLPDAVMVKQ